MAKKKDNQVKVTVLLRENRALRKRVNELEAKEQSFTYASKMLSDTRAMMTGKLKVYTIPKKITVLGETYKIRVYDKLPVKTPRCRTLGVVNHSTKVIKLIRDDALINTLLHEVGHIVNKKLRLSNDEELIANTLANIMENVFNQIK